MIINRKKFTNSIKKLVQAHTDEGVLERRILILTSLTGRTSQAGDIPQTGYFGQSDYLAVSTVSTMLEDARLQ